MPTSKNSINSGLSQFKVRMNDPVYKKSFIKRLSIVGSGLILLLFIRFIYDSITYESTDDAAVSAHVATLSTKVGGLVVDVPIEQNQNVHAGDILLKIESADYQNRVDQIQAELSSLQARLGNAQKVSGRSQRLLKSDSVSIEQAESASASFQELYRKAIGLNAQLAQAKLDLDRTTVRAPTDGKVGKRAVEKGVVVSPGQGVVAFVQANERWLDANFKETQIRHMKVGQEAEIEIDAIEGHTFKGKVMSFGPGTGATFAVLPPDNASGNFVKIVQRIPVRISFDESSIQGFEERLVPGLSANVSVRVR